MKSKFAKVVVALALTSIYIVPGYARGGFRGGGGFGGGGGFRGGDGGFGGGGFGGMHAGDNGFGGFHGGNHYDGHMPTDGGFGAAAGKNDGNIRGNSVDNNHATVTENNFNHYGSTNAHYGGNDFNHANAANYNHDYTGYGHTGYNHDYNGYHNNYNHAYANGYMHGYNSNMWHYPGGWNNSSWAEAACWTSIGLTSLTSFLGLGLMAESMSNNKKSNANNTSPASVTNITYQGDNVYINGQPSTTQQQYYTQAQQLANQAKIQANQAQAQANAATQFSQSGLPYGVTGGALLTAPQAGSTVAEKYEPLGVFSLNEPGDSHSNMLLQLAISQNGIVRGNYINQLTGEKSQVYGALDKKTQRISWTIGENTGTVFDSSLSDLTRQKTKVLVHYGPDDTRDMNLVRQKAPKDSTTTT
ncbi:MAG: hypothetical protein P4L53_21040 [Candidatus Obscuribacterales bacterium]|nr:hypothetical protein [Candidatus Obscuribacterales bacterium]